MPTLSTKDISQIGQAIVTTMAPLFYGTELGNHLYKEGNKFLAMEQNLTSDESFVPEENLRRVGFDRFVTETLDLLKKEKEKGIYQEGSLQGVALDYLIWEHENMIKRQSFKSGEFLNEQPAYRVVAKWANTRTVAKDSEEKVEGIDVDPDFKQAIMGQGKYSLSELDESFKSSNMNNLIISGTKYIDTVNKAKEIVKNGPADEEQLRQQIIADGEKLIKEINKLVDNVKKPDNEVALRIFDGGQFVKDFAVDGGRSLVNDARYIEKDIEYLKKGLPIAGLTVFQNIDRAVYALDKGVERGEFDKLANNEGYKNSVKELRKALDSIPEGGNELSYSLWQNDLSQKIQKVNAEYGKMMANPVFNPDKDGNELSDEVKSEYLTKIRKDGPLNESLERLKNLNLSQDNYLVSEGKKINDKRKKEFIDDLQAQKIRIGEELKLLKKEVKKMPDGLKKAVDGVIKECDPELDGSLKSLQSKLKILDREAKKYDLPADQRKKNEKLDLYNKFKDKYDFDSVVTACLYRQILDQVEDCTMSSCAEIDRPKLKQILSDIKNKNYDLGKVDEKIEEVIKAIDDNADPETFATAVLGLRQMTTYKNDNLVEEDLEAEPSVVKFINNYKNDYQIDAKKAKAKANDQNFRFSDYMKNTMPYINSRMIDATEKGVIVSEPLKRQSELIERNGSDRLDDAFAKFTSKRSGIFGKGKHYSIEFGNESDEHYDLRIAAQALKTEKEKLSKIAIDKDPEGWKKQAGVVNEKINGVLRTGKIYLNKVGYAANTGAGFQRMEGAMDLRREAALLNTHINKNLNFLNMQNKFIKAAGEHKVVEPEIKVSSFNEIKNKFMPEKKPNGAEDKHEINREAMHRSVSMGFSHNP